MAKTRKKCTDLRKLASRPVKDSTKPRGFFRVNIVEDQADGSQRIVGDSGWLENLTTNAGRSNYLINNLAGVGMTVGYIALGTGGAPASTDTTLAGEIMASTQRGAVTFVNQGSATALFTATFTPSAKVREVESPCARQRGPMPT
jgi:hypothetical protein